MNILKTTITAVGSVFIFITGILGILYVLGVIEMADVFTSASKLFAVAGIVVVMSLGIFAISLLNKDTTQ